MSRTKRQRLRLLPEAEKTSPSAVHHRRHRHDSICARQIVLAARPNGKPKLTDFRLEETEIATPAAGQLLLEVQYLSLDPYMRGRMDDRKSYATPLQLGDAMAGEAIAKVLISNHPGYAEGDIVLARTGWRTHALSDGADLHGGTLRKLAPAAAPVTTGLGVLGMPSPPIVACEPLASRSPVKPWWSRRRADRSGPKPRLAGRDSANSARKALILLLF
jgi:hypothetical protein